jgi:hypothetical protein
LLVASHAVVAGCNLKVAGFLFGRLSFFRESGDNGHYWANKKQKKNMASVQQFEDLRVWQEARALVREVYRLTKERAFKQLLKRLAHSS